MRRPKSDYGGRAQLVTHRNMTYVFCSTECSINFRSGQLRMTSADDEMYGCWQCGQNLAPDLGSIRSDGLICVVRKKKTK